MPLPYNIELRNNRKQVTLNESRFKFEFRLLLYSNSLINTSSFPLPLSSLHRHFPNPDTRTDHQMPVNQPVHQPIKQSIKQVHKPEKKLLAFAIAHSHQQTILVQEKSFQPPQYHPNTHVRETRTNTATRRWWPFLPKSRPVSLSLIHISEPTRPY